MKIQNDLNETVEIKIDPVIKILTETNGFLCFFCTQNEKIQIQDHGDYALIASYDLGHNDLPNLIGIIKDATVRLEENYNGEALRLKGFINRLFHRMLILKNGGKDELDIPKDQIQKDRI